MFSLLSPLSMLKVPIVDPGNLWFIVLVSLQSLNSAVTKFDFNLMDIKQLLDEVFVISGIIKVEVSVFS